MNPLLTAVSTADLLTELAQRCHPQASHQAPAWAQPVLEAVALEAGISVERLLADHRRTQRPTIWRHVAMALLLDQTHSSYQEIASLWRVDHSTVIYACKRVRLQATHPNELRRFLAAALSRLTPAAPAAPTPHHAAG